jgi:hypothetical protein
VVGFPANGSQRQIDETHSMSRRGHSVVFAALLLVAQLLSAVMSGGAMAHDGAQHCDGCPSVASSSMSHGMGSHDGTPGGHHGGGSHCATHCSHGGSTGNGSSGCGTHCATPGSGHCGSHANPALMTTDSLNPVVLTGSFGSDRRSVHLPDSPLFDFLRPPTRA